MILVLFELEPAGGQAPAYFDLAAALKPELERIDGFISIERFQSLADPDRYLSLSVWRDEAAVTAWRNRQHHREAQSAGRGRILADYRLRVAQVLRDYGMADRDGAPADSRAHHAAPMPEINKGESGLSEDG